MRILFFTSLIVIINCSLSNGQQMYFQSAFGDTAKDLGRVVIKTSTGEYCLVGATGVNTPDSSDIAIYFVDSLGELIANYSYKTGLPGNETPTSVVETSDGGFMVTGTIGTPFYPWDSANSDIFVLKIDGIFGNLLWTKTYGDTTDDVANSLIRTPDNYYVIAGSTYGFGSANESALAMKIDENGNVIWSKICSYTNSSGSNFFNGCSLTSDQQYIFAGGTSDLHDSLRSFVVKMDSLGNFLWNKNYDNNANVFINSIAPTYDGGYVAAGRSTTIGAGLNERTVMKLDSAGSVLWSNNYGSPDDDEATSVIEDANHDFVVCGITNVDHLGGVTNQMTLDKLDPSGNILWSNTYGDTTESSEGYDLIAGINNGYAASGFSVSFGEANGDAYLVKTDDNGYTECNINPLTLIKTATTLTVDSNFTSQAVNVSGSNINFPISTFVDQYAQNCYFDNISKISKLQTAKVFPNPANDYIQIETEFSNTLVNIFDSFGRRLFSRRENSYRAVVDVSAFSPGIYIVEVKSGKNIARNKFIKE
jgi:hypothetical protein